MSQPMYLSGDKYALTDYYDSTMDVDCGDCGQQQEVATSEEYSHGMIYWYSEYVCAHCGEKQTADGEYDPRED